MKHNGLSHPSEAERKSTVEEQLMLRELFSQIDVDGSGTLDESELLMYNVQLGLPPDQIRAIFSEGDEDGDGEISFEEFCKLFRKGDPNASWKQIRRLHRHRFTNDPLSYVRLTRSADASLQGQTKWTPELNAHETALMAICRQPPMSAAYVDVSGEENNLCRVRELLSKGARCNSRGGDEDSNTSGFAPPNVIMEATRNCHAKILGELVSRPGADLDAIDFLTGNTALHFAVRTVELEVLLAFGADRWKRNKEGANPAEALASRLVSQLHAGHDWLSNDLVAASRLPVLQ